VRAGDTERSREVAEVERQLAESRAALAGATAPLGRTEPARAGDVLTLTVAGEPTLPSRYSVLRDGTIRLPFVGSVSVQGMTADQIQDAVARQLTEKNLKTNPTVTVEIRRPAR